MKKRVSLKRIIGVFITVLFIQGCDTEEINPADINQTVTVLPQDVNFNSVKAEFNFQNLSEGYERDFGICYSSDGLATVEHATLSAHESSGEMKIESLKSGIEYSIRPYLTTAEGTAYGPEVKQKTKGLAGTSWAMTIFNSRGRYETDLLLTDETTGEHTHNAITKRVEYEIMSDVYLEIKIYPNVDRESLRPQIYKGRFIEADSLHYTEGRPWMARLKGGV